MISQFRGLYIQSPFVLDYVDQGIIYSTGHFFSSVGASSTVDVHLACHASYNCHMALIVAAGADCQFSVYEGPTLSNNGTAVTIYNMNRTSANTANALCYYTPTVTSAGTQCLPDVFISGGRGNNSTGSTLTETGTIEVILKKNTSYLFRATNLSNNSQPIVINMLFYERQ